MIGKATIDLRQRTIAARLGFTQRILPVRGAETVSASISGRSLGIIGSVIVSVSPAALSVVTGTQPYSSTPKFAALPVSDYPRYLHPAGAQVITFNADVQPMEVRAMLDLLSGKTKINNRVEIKDAQGITVLPATWATFYPDGSKLTMLQRTGLWLHELISEDCNIRYLLPALEQPGGTIETVRERVESNLRDLRRRKSFLPAMNTSLITGYYARAVETIEAAVEKNAPTITQQLDPIRTINFL